MKQNELKLILENHKKFMEDKRAGKRADLSGADLCRADLRRADLGGADLSGAELSGADLRGADLRRADLHRAYLSGADLRGADLSEADLRGADLSGADLSGADLREAYLSGAYLRGAYGIICIGPIGSRKDFLYIISGAKWMAQTGCFWGTIPEFENALEKTHGQDAHAQTYRAALALARIALAYPEPEIAACPPRMTG